MTMNEDDVVVWQDVLDEVSAGRRSDLRCPFCHMAGKRGELTIDQNEQRTRLECRSCRRYIEGRLATG